MFNQDLDAERLLIELSRAQREAWVKLEKAK